MIKHKEQRVGVFIDVQNLYYSAKNLHTSHVNFAEIVKEGVGERKLIRAIAYVVHTETEEEKRLYKEAETRRVVALKNRGRHVPPNV